MSDYYTGIVFVDLDLTIFLEHTGGHPKHGTHTCFSSKHYPEYRRDLLRMVDKLRKKGYEVCFLTRGDVSKVKTYLNKEFKELHDKNVDVLGFALGRTLPIVPKIKGKPSVLNNIWACQKVVLASAKIDERNRAGHKINHTNVWLFDDTKENTKAFSNVGFKGVNTPKFTKKSVSKKNSIIIKVLETLHISEDVQNIHSDDSDSEKVSPGSPPSGCSRNPSRRNSVCLEKTPCTFDTIPSDSDSE